MRAREMVSGKEGPVANSPPSVATAAATALKDLEELCASNELSIENLREKIGKMCEKSRPARLFTRKVGDLFRRRHQAADNIFFHRACLNEKVTLEIVEYLLETFPDAAENLGTWTVPDPRGGEYEFEDEFEAYPLHCCASNSHCPGEVIKLLIEKYPSALDKFCYLGENTLLPGEEDPECVEGLPLHFYLARENNVEIDIVRVLVEAYPQALSATDSYMGYTSLHIAVCNRNINDCLLLIIPYFLSKEPSIIQAVDKYGDTLLHTACCNKNAEVRVVERLFDAWPEAMYTRGSLDYLPIHRLCENGQLNEANSLSILRFMLDVAPDLPTYIADSHLPIHLAAEVKPNNFCRELIDACPGSLFAELNIFHLPIHHACQYGNRLDTVETIQYMLEVNPESIHTRTALDGYLPIHFAAKGKRPEILEFLLMRDPGAASRKVLFPGAIPDGALPLHVAASHVKMKQIEILHEHYPEAILVRTKFGDSPLDLAKQAGEYSRSPTVEKFLETQLEYARISQDMAAMAAVNEIGQLPLHHALKDNASLGTIQLMVRGNPSAFVADPRGGFPLHIACEFSSLKVVKFLVELCAANLFSSGATSTMMLECACCGEGKNSSNRLKLCTGCKMVKYCNVTCQKKHRSQHKKECKKRAAELQVEALFNLPMRKEDCDVLNHCDGNKDSILHYACRGGNLAVVNYLLESHASLVASTTVNEKGELPIHLLCEAGKEDKVDKESTEYIIETIWQLMLANPELLFTASSIFEGESLDQAEAEATQEVKGGRFDDEVTEKKTKKKSWRKKLSAFRFFSRKG